jgi:hypothetical protein
MTMGIKDPGAYQSVEDIGQTISSQQFIALLTGRCRPPREFERHSTQLQIVKPLVRLLHPDPSRRRAAVRVSQEISSRQQAINFYSRCRDATARKNLMTVLRSEGFRILQGK